MATASATPTAPLLDRLTADPAARDAVRQALDRLDDEDAARGQADLAALLAEVRSDDRWVARARPAFLYVMYALLLWAIPIGLLAAIDPGAAQAIARGMAAYLAALPEPLYALFGTGYLGYTVARSWGKARGAER
ncbi:3TM-type holin [Sphingomonas aerophila]|uniref:Holin of 3TMs, for gene-transfer release n=1 Tax=Sphingomonas aerophila TaxID=1344948 RepID=A0A7W9BD15_9SPHN|nr:3TM-type holin [Sphingomonas aerophila]MBB5715000.1 hypothetical protein [Sphingomonas aerophila]